MEKYGVCLNEKTAGMGPGVGYCDKCNAPVIAKDGEYKKTCDCKAAAVITFNNK